LFVRERSRPAVRQRIAGETLLISRFAVAEFSAALARRVRIGELPAAQAPRTFWAFDSWTARAAGMVGLVDADYDAASVLVRRLEIALRAPDALHVAVAQRLGATLYTLDLKMKAGAEALGFPVA
jgi:hypothetical protein